MLFRSGFLNLGTPNAFFTYCSKNVQSWAAFVIFNSWIMLQLVLVMVLITVSLIGSFKDVLFPGQEIWCIFVIAVLEWMNFLSLSLIQFGEAKAESIYVQKISFVANALKALAFLILFQQRILNLNTYIGASFISALVIIPWTLWFILSKKKLYLVRLSDGRLEMKEAIKYFINYCKPLVVYEAFGLVANLFDRWFLQTIAGAVQQAYYSLAFGWSSLILLFTTSVLNVFWRETSFAHGNNDRARVKQIYMRLYDFLFFLSAFLAWFITFNADKLLAVFVGKDYAQAQLPLIFMVFFSVYNTLGQINATFFYAVEEVVLYRNLSIVTMTGGIVLAYFFLAPRTYLIPGLGLGSKGLAIETFVLQFISSNLQLFFIARFLRVGFASFLLKQVRILLILGALAGATSWGIGLISLKPLMHIIIMFILYVIAMAIGIWFRPWICGFTSIELISYKEKILGMTKTYFQRSGN